MKTQQGWRWELPWKLGCWWVGVRGTMNTDGLGQQRGALGRRWPRWVGRGWGGRAWVLLYHKPSGPLSFRGPFAGHLPLVWSKLFQLLFVGWVRIFLLLENGLTCCSLVFQFQASPNECYYRS